MYASVSAADDWKVEIPDISRQSHGSKIENAALQCCRELTCQFTSATQRICAALHATNVSAHVFL